MTDLPVPLQAVAAELRDDVRQSTGRAVLLAVTVGLDLFAKHRTGIAAASGLAEQRLEAIINAARRALDASAPKVRKQHVVSQALLRQFCAPTVEGDRLLAYRLDIGRAELRVPRSVGKLDHFVKIDSRATEELWGLTETQLPAAIEAARTSAVLDDPVHVQTLKDALALHFARSREVLQVHDQTWEVGLASAQLGYLADKETMVELYRLKNGQDAVSEEEAAGVISRELVGSLRHLYETGFIFRFRVTELFEQARDYARNAALEIGFLHADDELLIGDVPSLTVARNGATAGVLGGVPFAQAGTVVMPLGPHRVASLGRQRAWRLIPRDFVGRLNALQVAHAQREVFMRPDSGLDSWVKARAPWSSR